MATILIVDDDPDDLFMTEEVLNSHGYQTVCVSDSTKALSQIKLTNPDLIILDVVMPKKDGVDVAFEIKHNAETSQIPLIFLTNLAVDGADSYTQTSAHYKMLGKPVPAQELLHTVKTALAKRSV